MIELTSDKMNVTTFTTFLADDFGMKPQTWCKYCFP